MTSRDIELIDSVTISCDSCKIDKTKNFYGNPPSEDEYERFKERDNRTCPHCEAPMEYLPHKISMIALQNTEVQSEPEANTAAKPSSRDCINFSGAKL